MPNLFLHSFSLRKVALDIINQLDLPINPYMTRYVLAKNPGKNL